jgi:hypothetical protein
MNLEHEQGHEDGVTQYTVAETEDYIWGVLNIHPLHIRYHQLSTFQQWCKQLCEQ